jgi:hypothetical protein
MTREKADISDTSVNFGVRKTTFVKQMERRRVPLSGAVRGFNSDVILRIGRHEMKGECKCRGRSFSRLYQWLADNDFLALRVDYHRPW